MVFIYSGGCSSNWAEGRTVINFLEANGHKIVDSMEKANVILFNACSVDESAEKKGLEKIRAIIEGNFEACLIIMGCVQQRMLLGIPMNTIVIPSKELKRFNDVFEHQTPIEAIPASNDIQAPAHWTMIERYVPKSAEAFFKVFKQTKQEIEVLENLKDEAWLITTSTGCLGKCSYCGIKKNRGTLKSFPAEKLVKEFRNGLALGKTYFKIWGDDVGCYGRDIGTDLAELLKAFLAIEREFHLEVLAANPTPFLEIFDKLLPLLRDKRVDRLVIPAQSGSQKILKAMNRDIDLETLFEKIDQLRLEASHLSLITHYIVGFPGETEIDFQKTIAFAHRTKLYQCLILKFDAKEGTLAAKMKNQISEDVKEKRKEVLTEICRQGVNLGTIY